MNFQRKLTMAVITMARCDAPYEKKMITGISLVASSTTQPVNTVVYMSFVVLRSKKSLLYQGIFSQLRLRLDIYA